jgi:hypothetical protein
VKVASIATEPTVWTAVPHEGGTWETESLAEVTHTPVSRVSVLLNCQVPSTGSHSSR